MSHVPESLRLHIEYSDYVTAHQVASVMAGFDGVYEALFYFETPHLREKPLNESKRLRVSRLETGSSLLFEFIEGAKHVVTSVDPNLSGAAGGAATVALAGKLVLHVATQGIKVFQDTKMRQLEIKKMKISNDEQEQALALKKERDVELRRAQQKARELAARALEQIAQDEGNRPTRDPQRTADLLSGPISQLLQVLADDNIGHVTLNGRPLANDE